MRNNKNTHVYMQAAANVMFTQIHANKAITLFGERAIVDMIKEFKQLYEGDMPINPVVIPLNPDELTDTERMKAIEDMKLMKEK